MRDRQQKYQKTQRYSNDYPVIPEKRYFSIGEVGELCFLKPHVLRYWEQEFPQLRPMKRRGNRRYYQREDVLLVRKIKQLLYQEGFTIEGAKEKLLRKDQDTPQNDFQRVSYCIKEAVERLEKVLHALSFDARLE